MTEPDLAAGFQHTRFLVMDEADRLLEASFEPDLRAILTKLPAKRQTLLFSATMTQNLVALQKAVLRDAYHFRVCSACSQHCVPLLFGFLTEIHVNNILHKCRPGGCC